MGKIRPEGMARVREAVAYGMLNLAFALESAAKANAPVAGAHRSFMTGPKTKAGKPRIGGTLRRSIHAVVYVDGHRLPESHSIDQNRKAVPDYVPEHDISTFIGTNVSYGFWVHDGTRRMAARPYLVEALNQTRDDVGDLIRAGIRGHDPELADAAGIRPSGRSSYRPERYRPGPGEG